VKRGHWCASVYGKSARALLSLDVEAANAVIDDVMGMKGEFDSEMLASANGARAKSVAATQVIGSLRRVAEYSADMCENVIDFSALRMKK